MITFTTTAELKNFLEKAKTEARSVGFVPTMGALHEGHLSLIERSVRENDMTICSIFVNPIQFNNPSDLEKYPRMPEKDLPMLENAGCDVVFMPPVDEMYPGGEVSPVMVDFGMLDKVMEGKFRPGHFDGVAIVVKRLFDMVNPDRAYFGKKDYQQLAVIRHMVNELNLPVEIIPCETVREPDGLAMSSRNLRLTGEQRERANEIYKVLLWVRETITTYPVDEIEEEAIKKINAIPGFETEYFEIADSRTLLHAEGPPEGKRWVACTAVFAGQVRLIDNLELFL
jgi:pantoate--beta-alanine ligase